MEQRVRQVRHVSLACCFQLAACRLQRQILLGIVNRNGGHGRQAFKCRSIILIKSIRLIALNAEHTTRICRDPAKARQARNRSWDQPPDNPGLA